MPYVNKPRPYKKEYDTYQGKPEQIKNRAKRNAARAELEKQGKVTKGDGKDVDHIKPFHGIADPLRLDWDNLQSICRTCHNQKTHGR